MSRIDVSVFIIGWSCGWLLLWRNRPIPRLDHGRRPESASSAATSAASSAESPPRIARPAIAVVVPARDEAGSLEHLVPLIVGQLRAGDELLVVDDHSTDETASIARTLGASVVDAPDLGPDWLGKPNACWAGAHATTAPILLFLDADVAPAPELLDRVVDAIERHPTSIVSVQPWHRTIGRVEQASLLFNVAALMGSGAFTIAGERLGATVAFGPVLALRRDVYERVGGHAAVRSMHTEDIGLARAVGAVTLYTGRPDTTFRMYPNGFRQLVDGWTRSIATGARATRWWLTIATACWITAIAGGWLAGGWPWSSPVASASMYAATAAQIWVLGRRAGSIHPLTAAVFPIVVAVFVIVVVRSAFAVAFRRDVTWKGRRVAARSS